MPASGATSASSCPARRVTIGRIMPDGPRPRRVPAGGRPTMTAHETILLDRGDELEAIEAAARSAAGGRGGVVVVEGPPGIGKTALLRATRSLAATAGLEVLHARGAELERE